MKPHPNHREYLKILRSMTSAQRANIAFDLSARDKRLLKQALRKRFPDMMEADLHQVYLDHLAKCHNRNY